MSEIPINEKCKNCKEKFLNNQECICKTCAINDLCEMALDENCPICLTCTRHILRQ